MAERRMFAKTIIDSDAFLDMPLSSQTLYFHLSMRADDDGFINNPKKIQRMIGASDDDLKILIAKKFIIPFESGIVVIKHWKIHNYIQKDRYKETIYQEEKAKLITKENESYSLDTTCIHDGYSLEAQDRLGKDRKELGKVRLGKDTLTSTECESIIEYYNVTCIDLPKVLKLTESRKKTINSRYKEHDLDKIKDVLNKANESDFLSGRTKEWKASFDWLMNPTNFVKVLEDNYKNKPKQQTSKNMTGLEDVHVDF